MSDSEQQYDRAHVNLWVDHDQKDRWDEHVDETPDLQHLSQLIRQAVERELAGNGDDQNAGTSNLVGAQLDSLENSINGLDGTLNDIEARLTSIERRVREDPDLRELMNSVFELLPTKENLSNYDALVASAGARPPNYIEPRANSGRPADIAVAVDASDGRVRRALRELQQDTYQVHSMEQDGETRFYKEG